ncbi:uncharacterized protein [Medicago truncatula]|uniref:uncharacterized protein n=1 Tax=Medicago truncatula TaxID=3880 RepID=UPI000D2F322A|nr:uncharacterized protein LOC25488213 [Medicago truncatula]
MLKKWFLSHNAVLGIITTKSTTPKFNNPLLHQYFSFPISLTRFCTTTTHPFAVSYLVNNFGFSTESTLKAFNNKQVFETNKDTIVGLIRYSRSFTFYPYHFLEANINLMVDFDVSDSTIARLLQKRPSIFGSKDLIMSLEEVKCLGFDASTTTFGTALMTKQCMSKILWDKKVDVFKKWGWSDEDVIRVFRCQPSLMLASIDKINLVMSFWVNQLGWDFLALTKCPLMFGYSLHKRIIPRASVLQFLFMKGLREKNASLVSPFTYSENLFLNKCVFSFKEESDYLLKLYEEKMKLANTKENIGMPSTKCVIY